MHETMKTILVVDDDLPLRQALKEAVSRMGYRVLLAEHPVEALKKMDETPVSMIVTDMKMPKMDGVEFIREARKRTGYIPILVITGYATVENAVNAMKEGACEYLMKPFSFDDLTRSIETIISGAEASAGEVLTSSEGMKSIIRLAHDVALSDMTVLILGESGTGKELLARYIHKTSPRNKKQLIAVNCAAIPENLLESELFGHEKGAFTGALEKKVGKFELAHGGTLLLDEIGEMSVTLQAKLLRVLQEKEIDRVGGRQPIPVDVRVIATTNRDLKKEMQEGRFREDLYYRLSVFPLCLPPLRERPEDIIMLSEHFARKFAAQMNKTINGFTKDAAELLVSMDWKGNIRELENAVHRSVLITRSDLISSNDFMFNEDAQQTCHANGSLKEMEMELILKTIEEMKGNKTKAAKKLGVSVRTIRNKLHDYGKNFPTV